MESRGLPDMLATNWQNSLTISVISDIRVFFFFNKSWLPCESDGAGYVCRSCVEADRATRWSLPREYLHPREKHSITLLVFFEEFPADLIP